MNKISVSVDASVISDWRSFNLLQAAADAGNTEIIKFFLDLDFDVNKEYGEKVAIDLAYEKQHFEAVLELLKGNSRYPTAFSTEGLPNELLKFVKMSDDMHASIITKNLVKVKEILKENSNLSHFYSTKNQSAFVASIVNKSTDIYKLLISKNIFLGYFEDFSAILEDLEVDYRDDLRKLNTENVQSLIEDHIMVLMTNSSVGSSTGDLDRQSKLNHVLKAFNTLNKIKRIEILLKIVAALKKFKLIFDFNHDKTQFIDPTSEPYSDGSFFVSGKIYIAAKHLLDESKAHKVYGVIAHEICHFVMFNVYKNNAKPYKEDDRACKEEFTVVSDVCKANPAHEEIIDLVYGYNEDQQHAELIVRVPNIVGHYYQHPEVIEEKHEEFAQVFDYYDNRCMPYMEAMLPIIIEENKTTPSEVIIKKQVFFLKWLILFLVIIAGIGMSAIYELTKPAPTYVWANLTEALKDNVMNANVSFQGEPIRLNQFLDFNSIAPYKLTSNEINDLITGTSFNVSKETGGGVDFFVDRKFQDQHKTTLNSEEVFKRLERKKILLLSDLPGAGKTTTFKYLTRKLKEKNPWMWVSYIDLKKHTEDFSKFESNLASNETISKDILIDDISKKILKNNPFDHEVFKSSFKANNVTFFWDGVDEISPIYEDFIIRLIKEVRNNSQNKQFVSFRTYLQKRLDMVFDTDIFRHQTFETSDRLECVKKFIKHQGLNDSKIQEEMATIQIFFEKVLKKTCDEDNPLMLHMICTLHFSKKASLVDTDVYSIYEQFIYHKFKLTGKKGGIVELDKVEVQLNKEGIIQAHHYYAILLIYKDTRSIKSPRMFIDELEIMKSEPDFTPQQISRYGILEIGSDGTFNFIHRTFAEFFVAEFIINNVYLMQDVLTVVEFTYRVGLITRLMNDTLRKLQVVTNFIDDYLKKHFNSIQAPKSSQNRRFIKQFRKEYKFHMRVLYMLVYHRYNKNNLMDYLEFFSSFWRPNYEVLKIYWHVEMEENLFIYLVRELRLWKMENKEWYEKFEALIRKHFKVEDLNKMIPGKSLNITQMGVNNSSDYTGVLMYYMWRERNGPQTIKARVRSVRRKHFAPNSKPIIQEKDIAEWAKPLVGELGLFLDIPYVLDFLKYAKDHLTQTAMKKLLICEFPELSITFKSDDVLTFWNMTDDVLSDTQMKKALQKPDFYQGTILHNMAEFTFEHFKHILDLIKKYLDPDEIKEALMFEDSRETNPIIRGFDLPSNFNHVKLLWNFAIQHLSKDDVKYILGYGENGKENELFLPRMTISREFFDFFSKVYEEYYDDEDFEYLLLRNIDKGYDNIIHYCALYCNDDINLMGFLMKVADNRTTMRKLLSERTYSGSSALSLAKSNSKAMFKEFVSLANEIFNPEELVGLYKDHEPRVASYEINEKENQTCKFSPDLPEALEKFTLVFKEIGLDKIIESYAQKSPKKIFQLIDLIKPGDIEKIGKSLNFESAKKIKNIINAIGSEKIASLEPETINHFVSLLAKIDINKVLNNFDTNFASIFRNLPDLDSFINSLTPESIDSFLG